MSSKTRDKLLEAAIVEFAAKGFDGATVRDICQRAGLNVNSVKYYFEDKQTLHTEAVTEAHRRMTKDKPLPSLPDDKLPEDRLRQYILNTMEMVFGGETRKQPHHLLMARELADPSDATTAFAKQFIRPRFEFVDKALTELLPDGFPEAERHMMVLSVVGQCMHYRTAAGIDRILLPKHVYNDLTPQRVANHIFHVIMGAIEYYRANPVSDK